jgi:lipid II isoglutaminyl synthase (glutamine-hydrolysing)
MSMSTARLTAAALAGRLAGVASRIARRGTGASIQGKVMLKLDPSALGKLLAGKRIAVVSGTNGKTTTTHFLAAALRESLNHDGNRLVHNADGANLHHGLASALSSRPEAEIAILETDERVVGDVIRLGGPEVLVLLNFSRDQLDRHHEIKGLGRSWRKALADAGPAGPIVVANVDEPLIVWAALAAKQVIWIDTATTWTQTLRFVRGATPPWSVPCPTAWQVTDLTGIAQGAGSPSPKVTTEWKVARSSTGQAMSGIRNSAFPAPSTLATQLARWPRLNS